MTSPEGLRVRVMEVGALGANAYLVEHGASGSAVVIDPGGDAGEILSAAAEEGLRVERVLLTHGHFDHVGAVAEIRKKTGAKVHIHADDVARLTSASRQGLIFGLRVPDQPAPDAIVAEGDRIPFGGGEFLVLHTPGHTPGCVSYVLGGWAFVGDLIFAGSIGRTDLPGGSYDDLIASVRAKIFTLPDDTVLLPGHGPATTVGVEKRTNPFFSG